MSTSSCMLGHHVVTLPSSLIKLMCALAGKYASLHPLTLAQNCRCRIGRIGKGDASSRPEKAKGPLKDDLLPKNDMRVNQHLCLKTPKQGIMWAAVPPPGLNLSINCCNIAKGADDRSFEQPQAVMTESACWHVPLASLVHQCIALELLDRT
eukprot:TRINITY_DN1855_c0_g1_i2.p1 TRINITY_DN1855_c0_g1~~TRINITY_DN1855_c0_g1_i2.p1  ORF type:complete len:152 (+),score=12.16 TRINITY_DN1855_c0_g1_i2:1248-1703(+)